MQHGPLKPHWVGLNLKFMSRLTLNKLCVWGFFFLKPSLNIIKFSIRDKLIYKKNQKRNHALCFPGRPLPPLLHWCTWLSPLLSSCTHLWQSGRQRGARLWLIHDRPRARRGWPTHRPSAQFSEVNGSHSSALGKVITWLNSHASH